MSKKPRARAPSRPILRESLEACLDRLSNEVPSRDDDGYSDGLQVLADMPFSPASVLAGHCLAEAIPSRVLARLRAKDPVVVVIETPSLSWVEPVATALSQLLRRLDYDLLQVARPPTGSAPKTLNHRVVRRPLIAIASDVSFLPRAVVAAADVIVRPKASAAAVSQTFRTVFGRSARATPRDIAGLDFDDIVIAIRPGSLPNECLARMRRAAAGMIAAVDDCPTLDELAGGGAAIDALRAIAVDLAKVSGGALDGAALPSVLLHGEPGTGKTTLAKALARTVGLPFITCSVGDWFSGHQAHLGTVIGSLRNFFEAATAASPCIAFIDELDAVPDRATIDDRGRDWWTPIIATLLVSIDRARSRKSGVVLVGATNHIGRLDAALTRPGRFDRHVEVLGLRGESDVVAVLRHYLLEDLRDVDLAALALIGARTKVTAATVREWVRGARERARERGADLALEDLVAVVSPPDDRDAGFRRSIAVHEAGHAVVGRVLGYSVAAVTILPHEHSQGVASIVYPETAATRREIEQRVMVALAGRAADEALGAGATGNAASDLLSATRLVTSIHGSLGLGDRLTAREQGELSLFDLDLQRMVESELRRLMDETKALVHEHAGAILGLTETLLCVPVALESDVDAALALRPEPLAEVAARDG